MLDKQLIIKQKTEADIAENEKTLKNKIALFFKMISDIEGFRKSEKNALKSIRKIDKIQELIKSLKVEKELIKYSPADKCGYLHNLSVTIGLLKQFEVFYQELKQKDKLRKRHNRPDETPNIKLEN